LLLLLVVLSFSLRASSTQAQTASLSIISVSPSTPASGIVGQNFNISVFFSGDNPSFGAVIIGVSNGSGSYDNPISSTCRSVEIDPNTSFQRTVNTSIPAASAPQSSPYTIWVIYAANYTSPTACPIASTTHDTTPYAVLWNVNGEPPIELPPDTDSDGVPDSRDACPDQGNIGYGVDTTGCPIPPPPDLYIDDVIVTQSVNNPHVNGDDRVDYVQGKALSVRVRARIDTPDRLASSDSVPFIVWVRYSNGTVEQLPYSASVSEILNLGNNYLNFQIPNGPTILGDVQFDVVIDPGGDIEESNDGNNSMSRQGDVKDTRSISMISVPINFSDNGNTVLPDTGRRAAQFDLMLNSFPLASQTWDTGTEINYIQAVNDWNLWDSITNFGSPTWQNPFGLRVSFNLIKRLVSNQHPNYERYVVYFPRAYANYYNQGGYTGWTYGDGQSLVLIAEYALGNTVAHELAHSYGIGREGYQDNIPDAVDSGFWVNQGRDMTGAVEIMASAADNSWIRVADYEHLFGRFRTDINDPELLVITGFVYANGEVVVDGLDFLPSGLPDVMVSNDAISYFNLDGSFVYSTPLGISYTLEDQRFDSGAFATKLIFPQGAVTAEISQNGQVLTSINLHTTLLEQMLIMLPDSAFDQNPPQRRNALLNQLHALEQQYNQANLNGILGHLYEFRDKLDQWLLPDYPITNPLQYTHVEALALVDELIARLEGRDTDGSGTSTGGGGDSTGTSTGDGNSSGSQNGNGGGSGNGNSNGNTGNNGTSDPEIIQRPSCQGANVDSLQINQVDLSQNPDIVCVYQTANHNLSLRSVQIFDESILTHGFLQAVDISGWLGSSIEICLEGQGGTLFLDAANSPRIPEWIVSNIRGNSTCATISRLGTVILVEDNEFAETVSPAPETARNILTNCRVTTLNMLNFRAEPRTDGTVITIIPYDYELEAIAYTTGWFNVIFGDNNGWVSENFVSTEGICHP
jgi:hypothetical protein